MGTGREVRYGSRAGAKALTRGGRGTYHGKMSLGTRRGKMVHAGAWVLLAMSFAGCEDAAKRPVQAHAPALNPSQNQETQGQRASAQLGPSGIGNLPVRNLKAQPLISLVR